MPEHMLGPHVVGQRVVVRRILPGETGPSGGAATTDLLGTCLSWDDETCVVQPASGPPVRIAVAEILTGKPVPPRGSVRDRVPPATAQRHGFALFADLETEDLGAWVLRRSAASSNRRANSVLALGPSGLPRDDDVAAVRAFYERHGQRPIAAVLADSPEDERLRALGWVPESEDADTLFQVAGLAQVARALHRLDVAPLPADATTTPGGEKLAVDVPGRGCGVAALRDDWLGLRSIDVEPAHRRTGLATAIVDELVTWGAEQGATTVYLQVLADNIPALALYERLGFRTHHTYRYLAL